MVYSRSFTSIYLKCFQCYTVSSLPIVLVPPDNPLKPNRIIDIDLRLPLFVFMKDPVVLLNVSNTYYYYYYTFEFK